MRAPILCLILLLLAGCATAPRNTACAVRAFAIRLHPGDDLRAKLEELTVRRNLRAAYVALTGPFEIVSLTGTLSPDGPHLHITVADATGRTFGGHLAAGSIVSTTAEVVVGELTGIRFRRDVDPVTSYKELVVE